MEVDLENDPSNLFNTRQTLSDGTVRKRLFPTPTAAPVKSFKFPRMTMSPVASAVPKNSITDQFFQDFQFLATPQPSRVETLSARRRPSIANIEGTPSVRKRVVCTNPDIYEARQAADLTAWLNHELLHPLHPPQVTLAAVNFPQYRLSQDTSFLRCLVDLHEVFYSAEHKKLWSRLHTDIRDYSITFKPDVDIRNDMTHRCRWVSLILLNYHPGWLLPALCVLFKLNFAVDLDVALFAARDPGRQSNEHFILMQFLEDLLFIALLSPHQHFSTRISPDTAVSSQPPTVERTNFHRLILQRTLELIFLLDIAKVDRRVSVHSDPPLFRPESTVRSSVELVTLLNEDFLAQTMDLRAFLRLRGFQLNYQTAACEVMRTFQVFDFHNDLRDGIRLCKIASLLTKDSCLLHKVKVPSGENMQREIRGIKMHNVEIAMRAISHFATTTFGYRFSWYSSVADIVEGNLSKSLSFLWQVVALWRDSELLKTDDLKSELEIVKKTFRKNKRKVSRLSQSPSAEMSLAEISPSINSPSNLRIYEECDNPNSTMLLKWSAVVCGIYGLSVRDFTESFRDGSALCLLLQHYYPDFVGLDEIVRLNPTELRPAEQSNREISIAQANFNLFTSRVCRLGDFPHIPISVEIALGPGFDSHEKQKSFGRMIDLLISYLFSQLIWQKSSQMLLGEANCLFETARKKTVQDQAAKVIVKALQLFNVRKRVNMIESGRNSPSSSFYNSLSTHRFSVNRGHGPRNTEKSPLGKLGSADRSANVSSRSAKPPLSGPFSGLSSFQQYLQKSPPVRPSARSEISSSLNRLINAGYSRSPQNTTSLQQNLMKKPLPKAHREFEKQEILRKKWAVDVISRHYLTFTARRSYLQIKKSIILLQACARGYLAKKSFQAHVDVMKNSENNNVEKSLLQSHEMGNKVENMVHSKDKIAELLSPVTSSVDLTRDVLPRIYEHMMAVERFTDRMNTEETLRQDNQVSENSGHDALEVGEVISGLVRNSQSSIAPKIVAVPGTVETTKSNDENEASNLSEVSTIHSPSSSRGPQSPETTTVQATLAVPHPLEGPKSDTVPDSSSVECENKKPAYGGWTRRAIGFFARKLPSFILEAASRADDPLTDARDAMNASASSDVLQMKTENAKKHAEEANTGQQQLVRSTSSPFPRRVLVKEKIFTAAENPYDPRSGVTVSAFDEVTYEGIDDTERGNQEQLSRLQEIHDYACEKYNEEIERQTRKSKEMAILSRRRRVESQKNFHALLEEEENDNIAFKALMQQVDRQLTYLTNKVIDDESYLSQLDKYGNEYFDEHYDLTNSPPSSSDLPFHDLQDALCKCERLINDIEANRLETRLTEAEGAFVEKMLESQFVRQRQSELTLRLSELKDIGRREELAMVVETENINNHVLSISLTHKIMEEAIQRISDLESHCIEPVWLHTAAVDLFSSSYGVVDRADLTDLTNYDEVLKLFHGLLSIRLAERLDDAEQAFNCEIQTRRILTAQCETERRIVNNIIQESHHTGERHRRSYLEEMEALENSANEVDKLYYSLISLEFPNPDLDTSSNSLEEHQVENFATDEDPVPDWLAFASLSTSNTELFVEIYHDRNWVRLFELFEFAKDNFDAMMRTRRMDRYEKWIRDKEVSLFNRELDEEELASFNLHLEETEKIDELASKLDIRRDELIQPIFSAIEMENSCSAVITEIDLYNPCGELVDLEVEASYRSALSENLSMIKDRYIEFLADCLDLAERNFYNFVISKRQVDLANWIQRREIGLKLQFSLDEELAARKEYVETMKRLDDEISISMSKYDAAKLVNDPPDGFVLLESNKADSIFGSSENNRESKDQWETFDQQFENNCSTVVEEVGKGIAEMRLDDALLLASDLFYKTMGEICRANEYRALRRSLARTVLTKLDVLDVSEAHTLSKSFESLDADGSQAQDNYENRTEDFENQLKHLEIEISKLCVLEQVVYHHGDIQHPEDACNALVFQSYQETCAMSNEVLKTRISEHLENAEWNFNEYMGVVKLRNINEWVSRMESDIRLRELIESEMQSRQWLEDELQTLRNKSDGVHIQYQRTCKEMVWNDNFQANPCNDLGDEIYQSEMDEATLDNLIHCAERMVQDLVGGQKRLLSDLELLQTLDEDIESQPGSEQPMSLDIPSHDELDDTKFIGNENVQNSSTSIEKIVPFNKTNAKYSTVEEYEELAVLREAKRSSIRLDRQPLQDVSVGHEVKDTPLRSKPLFDLDKCVPLFAAESSPGDEDFASLSSFASRPSSTLHHLDASQSQKPDERSLFSIGSKFAVGQTATPSFSVGDECNGQIQSERSYNEKLATPSVSLWRIGISPIGDNDVMLGRLSEELDALQMELSPLGSDWFMHNAGSMDRLKGVMGRISAAAASPPNVNHAADMEMKNSYTPAANIIRTVLLVMRNCKRSEEYIALVRLGMKIILDFCTIQECLYEVLQVEDSIDTISTCVQFYRDDESIFCGGVNVLHEMSGDVQGGTMLRGRQEIVKRLRVVKGLMTDHVERISRNAIRLQKANLVICALQRRKAGKSPSTSLAVEVDQLQKEKTPITDDRISEALTKLSEVIQQSE